MRKKRRKQEREATALKPLVERIAKALGRASRKCG
jgi:hypothetical protein